MPPKKKGGKKGKKGKKGADESSNAGGGGSAKEGKELNELGKEYFLIQIKDLEQRLVRYQKKCDELSLSNTEFEEKYKQLTQDRKEIVDFLKKSLEQRQDEISDLNDRLVTLQQAKEAEKESYENQLSQLKREFQDIRDQLTSENMILGGKLASLEEFKVQKEDLMKKFADMEEKLQQQEADHAEKIYNLERKAVVDKDRLKKEMVLRVNTVAAEFRKVSNKQMADTTKRNIRENVSINAQLAKMSEKTKELIQENDDLREKERKQRMQIELLESSQEDMAKKNHSNLKVLKMITSRAKHQEIQLADLEAREQEYMQLEETAAQTSELNEKLTQSLKSTEQELQAMEERLRKVESQRDDETAGRERLEDVLTAAAYTLKQVATESPDEDELVMKTKRKTMIDRLLLVLDSAALLGKAPPPAEFFQQRPKTLMAPLSIVRDSTKTETSQLHAKEFPHYNLGDLGLVPRPRKLVTKQATIASKVSHLSPTTRIGVKSSVTVGKLTPHALRRHDRLPVLEQKSM